MSSKRLLTFSVFFDLVAILSRRNCDVSLSVQLGLAVRCARVREFGDKRLPASGDNAKIAKKFGHLTASGPELIATTLAVVIYPPSCPGRDGDLRFGVVCLPPDPIFPRETD